jgi:hypothetical protein
MKYHVTNTDNPIDFPVTKLVHIVYVHPVENGLPNLHKVVAENEFENKADADWWIETYNLRGATNRHGDNTKAVYYGCVNDATGELV